MNLSNTLRQKTFYPFAWREFANSYIFLSMCDLNSDLDLWKIFYSKFKESDLGSLNTFDQIPTGLPLEYKEICPSVYRDATNKLTITFLAGNPELEIDFIPHQIKSNGVTDISASVATPIELFDNVIKYNCIFDSKVYCGVIGDTSTRKNFCMLKNKSTNKTYSIFTHSHDHSTQESIAYISQYKKTDNQFVLTLASSSHFRSVVYNIDTGKCRLINSQNKQLSLPTLLDSLLFYSNAIKISYDSKEICISNDIVLSEEFDLIEKFEMPN